MTIACSNCPGRCSTVEQVVLSSSAAPQATITRGFGVYNAVATLAGAAGALLGALPADGRLLGNTLIVVGGGGALLATRLAALGIEAPRPQGAATRTRPSWDCCRPAHSWPLR